jgi:hypothetical protein
MRADYHKENQLDAKRELNDLELEDVVGGSAKTFQANTNRLDPYRSYNFRLK